MAVLSQTLDEVRAAFARLWFQAQVEPSVAVAGTLELVGASFVADEETIFGAPSSDYIARELAWYESQSLDVADIPGGAPKIWRDVSSASGRINSNYGYLLDGTVNFRQYENVLKTLRESPSGRRAVAIYTRPSMHYEWNADGMRDFVCTNAVHYELRDDRLHVVVQMRSNDAVFGYKNDVAWQRHVQLRLLDDLRDAYPWLQPGAIIWQAASLHIYERHWYLLDHYRQTGEITISPADYRERYGV